MLHFLYSRPLDLIPWQYHLSNWSKFSSMCMIIYVLELQHFLLLIADRLKHIAINLKIPDIDTMTLIDVTQLGKSFFLSFHVDDRV